MKENDEDININDEYEKLFPPTERKTLFDDSGDYKSLREYIMAQPHNSLHKRHLPFTGVELIDYVDFRRDDAIDKATKEHKNLYFIRQSEKGREEYCNAVGYYETRAKSFVLMPYSYIVAKANRRVPLNSPRDGGIIVDGINRYITHPMPFNSPEEAASFVLGQKAGIDEWVDRRGKGILNYYPNLINTPEPVIHSMVESQQAKIEVDDGEMHIFTIFAKGICKASGYFDPRKGFFYILKNSLLALNTKHEYDISALGIARSKMIAERCTRIDGFYMVNKDTKCRSASAAASYVLGKDSSYIEWEDSDGKSLYDFYPERFYSKKEPALPMSLLSEKKYIPEGESVHIFCIQKVGEKNRECNAYGYFDESTKTFILKEGSKWASDVTKGYQFTASEFKRRNQIKKNCKVVAGYIIQSRDILCESPSAAASFVLGRAANGWEEWKDKYGNSLKSIYGQ